MSLEVAIQANTAAIYKLIEILGATDEVLPEGLQPSTAVIDASTVPADTMPTADVTVAECQAAAADAVLRLGGTPEAKQQVKDIIAKHGAPTIPKLEQLQLNACHDELEKL